MQENYENQGLAEGVLIKKISVNGKKKRLEVLETTNTLNFSKSSFWLILQNELKNSFINCLKVYTLSEKIS